MLPIRRRPKPEFVMTREPFNPYQPPRPPSAEEARGRIPDEVRQEVYKRDGFKCLYCRGVFPPDKLSIEHIIPRSRRGHDLITNYATACRSCNSRRRNFP